MANLITITNSDGTENRINKSPRLYFVARNCTGSQCRDGAPFQDIRRAVLFCVDLVALPPRLNKEQQAAMLAQFETCLAKLTPDQQTIINAEL